MNNGELTDYLLKALDGLKDFQSASVEAIFERLYGENRPRVLLADEVGLGKTIVARGLIAKILLRRIEEGVKLPLRVTYVCSNQVIAGENFSKLSPFPKHFVTRPSVSRISYLAWKPAESNRPVEQNLLEINTLTPATSFDIDGGTGNKQERQAIFSVLCRDLKMRNRKKGLYWVLMGTVRKTNEYKEQLDRSCQWDLREDLWQRFITALKQAVISTDNAAIYDKLPGNRSYSLYDATIAIAERVDGRNQSTYWRACNGLCQLLRKELINCCIGYVDADLYILDEFQRFRDLIDENSEEEQARIAREVFKRDTGSRVLLLSATPFKAFTGDDDAATGENHFKDFNRVLEFLLSDRPDSIQRYHEHRGLLYRQIRDVAGGDMSALSPDHRDAVQSVLRSVVCRTERHSVAVDPNILIRDLWKEESIPFGAGDIENFCMTDQLAQALQRINCPAGVPLNYCKSAPFPMSFLDRYSIREYLDTHRMHPEVLPILRSAKAAWVNMKRIHTYKWSPQSKDGGPSNARLDMLLDKAIGPKGASLLWVPPSLPYYNLEDAFEGTEGFSKTLLFSSWIMVPRMVASLLSYEVERRTIGNPKTLGDQEAEKRRYFSPPGKRRHPVPQLTYSEKRSQDGSQYSANMSNFTLLYPSRFLAGIVDPVANLQAGHSLADLREATSRKIREKLEVLADSEWIDPEKPSDRWYWAAPLLLDQLDPITKEAVAGWLENPATWTENSDGEEAGEEETSGAKQTHLEFLKACFENPAKIQLGRMPNDLPGVLADLALGSPAVLMLRTLTRHFPAEPAQDQLLRSFLIAGAFTSLFNKPESIAAIRLSEVHAHYWQMVVDYCASGCLQAVLDEYFHLLVGQTAGSSDAVSKLLSAVSLTAATISVDGLDSFMKRGTTRKMRCHYAVEFGSQKIDSDQGQKRASSVRELFNSPFRPFVLATTSIGQEGLDFHFYCRRIVHWNLPGNPIDIEQREGRINRFKGLTIRQQIARKFGAFLRSADLSESIDPWQALFEIADKEDRINAGKCELVPYWHIEGSDDLKIERIIPLYPFSIEHRRLARILRTLAIYRLAFGQPRQAELVEHFLDRSFTPEQMCEIRHNLLINLSPITYSASS